MNFIEDIQNRRIQTTCDVVWGKTNQGATFLGIITDWLTCCDNINLPKHNSGVIIGRLTKLGYSANDIYDIRSTCTEAMKTARDWIIRKHKIDPKYVGQYQHSFGVYQLYLNVGDSVLNEFGTLAYKLFQKKLKYVDCFKEF
jgi:hypothetical protein